MRKTVKGVGKALKKSRLAAGVAGATLGANIAGALSGPVGGAALLGAKAASSIRKRVIRKERGDPLGSPRDRLRARRYKGAKKAAMVQRYYKGR